MPGQKSATIEDTLNNINNNPSQSQLLYNTKQPHVRVDEWLATHNTPLVAIQFIVAQFGEKKTKHFRWENNGFLLDEKPHLTVAGRGSDSRPSRC